MAKPQDSAAGVAGELREVMVLLKRRIREEAPPNDMSWGQLSVLGQLDRAGPCTVSELARAESVRPQSMGETVAALQKAGFVQGQPDPNDGRRTLLSLTPSARDLVRARRAAREDWLMRRIKQKFSAPEQKQLCDALALLRRLAEKD
ncbi:DNA-binding MarR family transcriptional regulator [Rhizomicrobium palustre]|uniref:DNA-binding MarR family transcriptional regulator n=1 Tax=Rhizomicrobium palustre TaxID=189966 RepID=A0A846N379_9PROT|nr:MarR family transcriptional regulator [Rhizomicrobium palustre]NIK90428.1 DNA-binding MarR family transcriptional regulator [Rhizomicrobium palustre]